MPKNDNKWDRVHNIRADESPPTWFSKIGATIFLIFMGAIVGAAVLGFYPHYRAYFADPNSGDNSYHTEYRRNRRYKKQVESEGVGAIYSRQIIGGIIGALIGGALGLKFSRPHRKWKPGPKPGDSDDA